MRAIPLLDFNSDAFQISVYHDSNTDHLADWSVLLSGSSIYRHSLSCQVISYNCLISTINTGVMVNDIATSQ